MEIEYVYLLFFTVTIVLWYLGESKRNTFLKVLAGMLLVTLGVYTFLTGVPGVTSVETNTTNITLIPTVLKTGEGTVIAGTVASLASDDLDIYNVSETTGAPGFDVFWNYTGVNNFTKIVVNNFYLGNAGHTVNFNVWNYTSSAWATQGQIPSRTTDQFGYDNYTFGPGYTDLVSGGVVRINVNHTSPGNVNHDWAVDSAIMTANGTTTITYLTWFEPGNSSGWVYYSSMLIMLLGIFILLTEAYKSVWGENETREEEDD